jgi:hypothetical protein
MWRDLLGQVFDLLNIFGIYVLTSLVSFSKSNRSVTQMPIAVRPAEGMLH